MHQVHWVVFWCSDLATFITDCWPLIHAKERRLYLVLYLSLPGVGPAGPLYWREHWAWEGCPLSSGAYGTHTVEQALRHWTAFSAALWGPRNPDRVERTWVSFRKARSSLSGGSRKLLPGAGNAASVHRAAGFSQNNNWPGTKAAVSRCGAGGRVSRPTSGN